MGRVRKQRKVTHCVKEGCDFPIPSHKRSDAKYCSDLCKEAAEKKRYCDRNPEYVTRQRRNVCERRHMETYGHTDFIDKPMANKNDKYARARSLGYRSGLEVQVARQLEEAGVSFEYEKMKIRWLDSKDRVYTPDYVLDNGIVIETKGRFVSADRRKHKEIRKQYPNLDLRFVFTNPNAKINKGSRTSYGDWCTQHGFKYASTSIPEDWMKESKDD